MNIVIRPSNENDIKEIIELQSQSLFQLSSKYYNQKQKQAIINSQKRARSLLYHQEKIYVAEIDGEKIIGFACFIYKHNKLGQIGGIYVHPDYFRKGVGTKLIEKIEEIARQYNVVILEVFSSLDAVVFYRKKGYTSVRRVNFVIEFTFTNMPTQFLYKKLKPISQNEADEIKKLLNYEIKQHQKSNHLIQFILYFIIFFLIGFFIAIAIMSQL
ncbi:GNAT family N-acetyltransferase [Euhalothece natronophila Z-M001]|uniref:GNAT family N-acetyltransferase n=1 Tax=Euhalothece natronophila Z-M001 TaxID=522448 RepID=A0A5B8NNR8_9CHRO|nr:GNAT family N-acetyltransferase [Euhalothece natronophila]QDZ39829.1 GNAT family N-acetyltransferase [Euhalothece natronophila Z-M001]